MYHKPVVLSQTLWELYLWQIDFSTEEWKNRVKYLSSLLTAYYLTANGIHRLYGGRRSM